MSSTEVTIPHDWTPRPHQRALFDQFGHGKTYRRGCAVWHRRAGKDSCALNLTARDMFRRVGTYWHLFPEQAQARRAIWNGIDRAGRRIIDQMLPPAVRARTSAQEMLIETVNGSIWQMAGSDNFDSLVGSNPVGVVFSEWALSHPDAWEYLRPILVENDGWALFIYTPRGRNHGHATYLRALEADTWFCEKLTVDDTGLITPAQIEEERRAGMSDGKIGQEFFCSFDADIDEQLISHDLVSAAMARQATAEAWEEKVIGVDVARFGDDKSALYFRHGRDGNPRPYERYAGLDTMELAAKVAERISIWSPDAVFVDDGGVGGGVVDRLHQLGFGQVIGVNFGGKADRGGAGLRAGNKRSEMWLAAREWLQRGALPRDELLAAELTAPMYAYNAANALMLEPKADMKRRGVPSPDVADAFALTFAYPVQRWDEEDEPDAGLRPVPIDRLLTLERSKPARMLRLHCPLLLAYRTAQRTLGSSGRRRHMRIIGYERVSTARQGASGLGIEAQRQAIEGFAAQRDADLIARFTEVESGRNPDRPELGKALHLAKVTGATLVIAKLDRLSRNAAFLLTLRDSGVRFAAVDLPEANDLTVGIMALVAQQEREAISRRTKEALAVARSRGVRLGNPNGAAALRRAGKGGAPLRAAIARNADRHARDLAPVVEDIRAGGATSLRDNRGRAERARHAHPPRRALARLDGHEPARPARGRRGASSG